MSTRSRKSNASGGHDVRFLYGTYAAIAASCVLVWTGVIMLRGGPLAGCLLFLAAATCLSADFFGFNVGTVRLTLDRFSWRVVMLHYLIWRQQGWTDPKPLEAADKIAFALIAYHGFVRS